MADLEQADAGDILFVGDVHLGRRPVGLDQVLADRGLAQHQLSPAAALRNLADHALEHPPRAVVFAGDLVDQDDDRFEAYATLEREVERLRGAGIPVLAVAGNHDSLVLPQLVARVPGVRLLGAGGTWERHELEGSGPPVDLLGWSFPGRHVKSSPLDLDSFAAVQGQLRPEALALGVVHGDLGATSSPYAPLSRTQLEATPVAGWFLGHVHTPGDLGRSRPIGYLGSLTGLHANETGARGPWRVRAGDGGVHAFQIPLAPVRWEALEVELADADALEVEAVHARIEASVLAQLAGDRTLEDRRLQLIVARVRLTGSLGDRGAVPEFAAQHAPRDTVFTLAGITLVVERVRDDTRTRADLELLAAEPTAIGHVASRLLELQGDRAGAALQRARETTTGVVEAGWRADDDAHPLPDVEVLAERAAWAVLENLLAQRAALARA